MIPSSSLTGEKSINPYVFVENNPFRYIDINGEGFWDWLSNLFDSADQTETARVRDVGMAVGAAHLAASCIGAKNAVNACAGDPDCDNLAELQAHMEKICGICKDAANAALGGEEE
jgi:hypothetical protein